MLKNFMPEVQPPTTHYLIATIEHVDENTGEVINTGRMIIDRAVNYKHAVKLARRVRHTIEEVHIGYENGEKVFEERKIKRKPLTYNSSNGKNYKEVIKKIDILEKSEYYKQ